MLRMAKVVFISFLAAALIGDGVLQNGEIFHPSVHSFVHLRAKEPAGQALDPASQASEPARQASEPVRQASEPAIQASDSASQASGALRPTLLALRPDWLGLRPAWLALGPSRGERMDGQMDGRMDRRKISPFYRNSSPIGAAALLQPNFNPKTI